MVSVTRHHAHLHWAAVAAVLTALASVEAHAQDPNAISSARETAKSGIEDYYAGNYEAAHDKLARAFAVVPVSTLALFNARALVKTGKLVEAAEAYLIAARLPNGEGDASTQQQARVDAKTERASLLTRIPRLRIAIVGAPIEQVTVLAGGVRVLPTLFATGWMLNPGDVEVTATYGAERLSTHQHFAEGEKKTVTLTFAVEPKSLARPAGNHTLPPAAMAAPDKPSSSGYRTATWASLGVGAAGLTFGLATGIWAIAKRHDLDSGNQCDGSDCYPGTDIEGYNRLRRLSVAGFVVGAAGGITGALLYLNVPSGAPSKSGRVTPWVGVGSCGLRGAF